MKIQNQIVSQLKERPVQVTAQIPADLFVKIKAIADAKYEGRLAQVVRQLIVKGAEDLK